MEPVDYIKIAKNHWKVILGLVLLAIVAVYITTPKKASKAFSAETVIYLASGDAPGDGTSGSTGFNNPRMVAAFYDTSPIPENAKKALGWTGTPSQLAGKVKAFPDSDIQLPFVHLQASGSSADEAIRIANAYAQAVVDNVDERETARIESNKRKIESARQTVINQAAALDAQIKTNPPNASALQLQHDTLINQLANDDGLNPDTAETAKASYQIKKKATSASTEASFISGAGPAQRALLGAVVAAMLGFGVAIMLDRSDSRLRTKEATERHFGLPVLAEIPLLNIRDRSRAAVVAFERVPRVAEAYRSLRTALLLFRGKAADRSATNGNGHGNGVNADPNSVRQLVVVTSPEAGDGKSTTTANLAMAYAETGQSVLLVSWDLWRPLSPGVFNAQEGPGVSDYLDGHGSSLVRYVQDTSIPGVRIVTAGLGGHHPTAQIEAARRLLEEARTLANVVIVDTAPILSASVTRELVTLADAVLVICRSGRTNTSAADRCAELLERLGAPTLGVVLVGVPTGPFADYYGAPPKGIRRFDIRKREQPRHKAPGLPGERSERDRDRDRDRDERTGRRSSTREPLGSSLRPTAAQYRATAPRSSEGGGGREHNR